MKRNSNRNYRLGEKPKKRLLPEALEGTLTACERESVVCEKDVELEKWL